MRVREQHKVRPASALEDLCLCQVGHDPLGEVSHPLKAGDEAPPMRAGPRTHQNRR